METDRTSGMTSDEAGAATDTRPHVAVKCLTVLDLLVSTACETAQADDPGMGIRYHSHDLLCSI